MSHVYELERLCNVLSETIRETKQTIDVMKGLIKGLNEVLHEIKRYSISPNLLVKKELLEVLKWHDNPSENIEALRKAYRKLVVHVVSGYAPFCGKYLDQCGDELIKYHEGVLELIKKLSDKRDIRLSTFIDKVVGSLEDLRRDPCHIVRDPSIMDLFYELELVVQKSIKKFESTFDCKPVSYVENAIWNYMSTVTSIEALKTHLQEIRDILKKLDGVSEKYGTHNEFVNKISTINRTVEVLRIDAYITKSFLNSMGNLLRILLSNVNNHREGICRAETFNELVDKFEKYYREPERFLHELNELVESYRVRTGRLMSRFEIRAEVLDQVRKVTNIIDVVEIINASRKIDDTLTRVFTDVLRERRSVFEKLLQYMEETNTRTVQINRSLTTRFTREEMISLLDLCIEGVLECTIHL